MVHPLTSWGGLCVFLPCPRPLLTNIRPILHRVLEKLQATKDVENIIAMIPPSTGKKKKARRVFGNILNHDSNNSLSYTPSPPREDAGDDDDGDDSQSAMPSKTKLQARVISNLFSIAETASAKTMAATSSGTGKSRRTSENSHYSGATTRSESSTVSRSQQSTVVVQPFSKLKIGESLDENVDGGKDDNLKSSSGSSNNLSNSSLPVPDNIRLLGRYSEESKLSMEIFDAESSNQTSATHRTGDSIDRSDNNNSRHNARRTRGSLSSVDSDLTDTKLPQTKPKAPRKLESSVNQALNAAKRAREKAILEKAQAVAMIRGQLKEEKDEALEFQLECEKMRREQLHIQTHLSSQFSRARAQRQQKLQQAKREAIVKESTFKSEVAREQQQKLKEQEEQRRRQSMVVRAKIRENNRQGKEKLQLMKIEEEQAILEERLYTSKARQEYQRNQAEKARKSFLFRAGDAKRIRELHSAMESQQKQEECKRIQLKHEAERDVDSYKAKLAEERRQSLVFRNAQAATQRKNQQEQLSHQQQAEHESYELKRAAELDVVNHKRQINEERRKSLAFRNQQGSHQRQLLEEQHAQQQASEQESLRLKFEAEKDAEAYRRNEALLRRKSLAQRNLAAREIRTKLSQQETERQQKEHESLELKLAGEKDIEAYKRKLEELRRQSLEFRTQQARQQREQEEIRQGLAKEQAHKSYELKWEGERDTQAYQHQLEEERRLSLQERNVKAIQQRQLTEEQKSKELQAEQQSFQLKRAADKDVEKYREQTEQERRESLAFRNQEKVRHAKVMEELNSLAKEEQAESYRLKWEGERDAKAYEAQLEEERRKSLYFRNQEARRHKNIADQARQDELLAISQDEALRAASMSLMFLLVLPCFSLDCAN